MSKPSQLNRTASPWQSILASAMLWGLVVVPQAVIAGEGGTTHVIPGSKVTIEYSMTAKSVDVKADQGKSKK